MSVPESGAAAFGRQVLVYARTGATFQRFDVVPFLAKESEMLGWNGQKEMAEEWLDVLVGAGLLSKTGHGYQIKAAP